MTITKRETGSSLFDREIVETVILSFKYVYVPEVAKRTLANTDIHSTASGSRFWSSFDFLKTKKMAVGVFSWFFVIIVTEDQP